MSFTRQTPRLLRPVTSSLVPLRTTAPTPSLPPRIFASCPLLLPSSSHHRNASTSPKARPLNKSTQLKDEDIPHPLITLVDPTTNTLLPPASLSDILLSLDRTRFSILLVDPNQSPPLCKILDKKAVYENARNKAAEKKAAAIENAASSTPSPKASGGPPKEVQLSWGVTAHDLSHKLNKAKELLGKGARVTVVLKDKKGADSVGKEGRKVVMQSVEKQLEGKGKLVKAPSTQGGMVLMEFVREG